MRDQTGRCALSFTTNGCIGKEDEKAANNVEDDDILMLI